MDSTGVRDRLSSQDVAAGLQIGLNLEMTKNILCRQVPVAETLAYCPVFDNPIEV